MLFARQPLTGIEFFGGAELLPLRMPERGVVVETHLGIERMYRAVGPQYERVDLGEIAIAFRETPVQLHKDVGSAVDRRGVQLGVDGRLVRRRARDSIDRIDVHHHDRVGIAVGHRLDLDTTLRGQHQQMLLRGTIEREARVVLLGDVGRVFHPQPAHHMALDVHAEDVPRVQADLVGVVRELDTTGLAPSAHLYLRLDHHGVARRVGRGDRLFDRVGRASRRHRDSEAGEVLLALVLE
jgi:hypothetical protein